MGVRACFRYAVMVTVVVKWLRTSPATLRNFSLSSPGRVCSPHRALHDIRWRRGMNFPKRCFPPSSAPPCFNRSLSCRGSVPGRKDYVSLARKMYFSKAPLEYITGRIGPWNGILPNRFRGCAGGGMTLRHFSFPGFCEMINLAFRPDRPQCPGSCPPPGGMIRRGQ